MSEKILVREGKAVHITLGKMASVAEDGGS